VRGWATVTALGAAVLALVVVFVALPKWVAENGDQPRTPTPAPGPEAAPVPPQTVTAATVEDLLARVTEIERRHPWEWAGPAWAEVRDRAQAVSSGVPEPGVTAELERRLTELEAAAAAAHDDALEQGRAALARGDTEGARRAFERAARIRPSSPGASAGLRSVEVHDRVFRLVETARERERRGDLRGATAAARQAIALDPACADARDVLGRSEQRLADQAFAAAMSDGLAALAEHRFEAARAAFTRAAELRPGAAEAADGLLRVDAAELRAEVSARRGRAVELESAESWSEAAREYAGILALDASLGFARAGEERCRARAGVAAAIDEHLANPDRLASEQVLEAARDVLAEARALEPQGPRHRDRLARLAEAIRLASTPVPVTLTSDGLTEVTVYHVGRLGAFARRLIELRPGTYVIVGRRDGFRDTRHELRVEAGSRPTLDVRCTDRV
jgi:tetratricopeptide (TPR) repeat protein